MYELVYYSIAAPNINKIDIEDILEISRANNKKYNITGCLIYHNGQFTQILEGEKDDVLAIYSKIEIDTRHHTVTLLYKDYKKKRTFETWSMGYAELTDNDMQGIQQKAFSDKLILLADLASKPTTAVKIFWDEVRDIIDSKNPLDSLGNQSKSN